MRFVLVLLGLLYPSGVPSLERRAPARVAVTPHVLALQASNLRYPLKFSSHYLHKRFNIGRPAANLSARQDEGTISSADMQHSIQTLGGRVYMTTVNLSMQPYTLVIDTGSSDTWIASTTFQCVDQFALIRLQQSACGFGKLYEAQSSNTRGDIKGFDFEVRYTDGEFLHGNLTTEILELAGLVIRQVIGVVDMGWWMGDGASSGLLGLAYPGLASNSQSLNYTSVIFNLLGFHDVPPMFSLALTRPTLATPTSGGLLAIGGVPNVDNDGQLITVPIQPVIAGSYAFYAIRIDGFVVLPRTAPSTVFEPQLPPSQNFTVTPIAAVVDSGSTLMYLPNNVTDYIAASFSPPAVFSEMTGMWMAGCGAVAPRVGIIIGGKTFWVDARDLINNETNGGGVRKTGLCAIASQRASAGDAVLGDAFLKNVIAVFDLGRNEMGFLGRTAV